MGRPANFNIDDEWQRRTILKIQKAGGLPGNLYIDNDKRGHDASGQWEFKTVRWKGKRYTAFALETWSDNGKTLGWMDCDDVATLAYFMMNERENGCRVFWLDFLQLQNWFFDNNRFMQYGVFVTQNYADNGITKLNLTIGRVVPVNDIPEDIYYVFDRPIEF